VSGRAEVRGWALAVAVAVAVVLAAGGAAQEAAPAFGLAVDDERPQIGQTVRVTVTAGGAPLAGARVAAVYRPNSETTSTEHLAPTDASGTAFWTPSAAGPVRLEAWPPGSAEEAPAAVTFAVAVRFGGFPPSGLAIMVIAGLLLLGGAAFGLTMLLGSGAPLPPTDHEPPST
jgi:hypothetical protein